MSTDASPKQYRKKAGQPVVAVQMNLETEGLIYQKWGSTQIGKQGDWLVNNGGDVYTVDAESFAGTYESVGLGQYVKTATVWAVEATEDGVVPTKEGTSEYKVGDYIVSNKISGEDMYCISREKFKEMYEEVT